MKKIKQQWQANPRLIGWLVGATLAVDFLLLYRLGSLTHGLSQEEILTANAAVGWHGLYHAPLDLPINLIRSVVFYISPAHGQTLTRLPNVIMGALAIIAFSWLTWLWHGRRTALLATALFATSAWTLHVSRYASYDVVYLWAISSLLLGHALLKRYNQQAYVWCGVLALWGLLFTVPGMVWFLLIEFYLQRSLLKSSWQVLGSWWQRCLGIIALLLWLPLVAIDLGRHGQLVQWLGLPAHLAGPVTLLKQFIGVFVHLFVRGPAYPTLWLGRAPILDAFTLAMAILGIYFYGSRWGTSRSNLLIAVFVIGAVLVALQGPVGLSALVPVVYATVAMGIAYLLHEWLLVFPRNPLARSLGIGLVSLVVAVSCLYNVRAYFVAWPHNPTTQAIFHYRR